VAIGAPPLAEIAKISMTRKHRSVHRLLWPALALTLAIAFALSLYLRPPAAVEPTEAPKSQQ
jgi:hypothetical protein